MTTPLHTPAPAPTSPKGALALNLGQPAQYTLALGAVGLAILVRQWLDPYLGARIPFVFTLLALAVIVWPVRLAPYTLAATIGILASDYLFIEPRYTPGITTTVETIQVSAYLFLCVGMGAMAAAARRSSARAIAAAHALREKDILLGTVAQGSATLLAYVDADLRYRFVNDAYCRHFGVHTEKVLGRTVAEQLGPDAYDTVRPHLDRVFIGERVEFETDIPYATLGLRRMRIAFTPDVRADGYVAGFTAALHDVTEERRAAEALRRGEERFRLATEAFDGIVYDWDYATGIVSRSAGLAGLIGIPADAAPRTAAWWSSRVHPDDWPVIERAHREAVARKAPSFQCEYRVRHDDGRWVWVWDHARHVYAPDGSFERAVGCTVSVDGRKRAEQALRDSEAYFRTMANSAPAILWLSDAGGHCTFLSRGWQEFTGQEEHEAIALGWTAAVHPDDRDAVLETLRAAGRAGEPFTADYRLLRHDGVYRWVVDSARPLFSKSGDFIGFIGSVIDIHDRKQAESEMREAQAGLRMALEAGRMGTWEWDLRTHRMAWSPGLEALHGLSPGSFGGAFEDFQRDIHPEDRERVLGAIRAAVDARTDYRTEYRILLPDGRVRWVESRGRFTLDDAGRPVRMAGVCMDTTERRVAEETVRRNETRLRVALEAAHAGAWDWDLRTDANTWTPEHFRLFGIDPAEPDPIAIASSLIHPDDRDAVAAAAEAARISGQFEAEFRVLEPGGAVRWFVSVGRRTADGGAMTGITLDITERRRVQDALRESEERLRRLMNILPVGVYTCAADGTIAYYNPVAARLWGREPALGDPGERFCAAHRLYLPGGEPVPPDRTAMAEILTDGRPRHNLEIVIERPDGARIDALANIEPLVGPDGRPAGAISVFADITERKRAEDRLRRNHETFVTLIEHAPFGVYVVDADFRLRLVSAGSRRAFSTVQPLIGRDFAEIVRHIWPEPFATQVIDHFRHTLLTGEPYASPDSTERRSDTLETESYDWKVERITLPDGSYGVVCYFYDVTERRRAEQALRESERRLQAAYAQLEATYSQSPLGMCEIDRECRFVRVNDALAAMNGRPPAEHVGRTVREIVPTLADEAEARIRRILRTGEPSLNIEMSGVDPVCPDVEGTWLQSLYPLRDADGQITGVSIVVQDITDRKRVENELARYRQHLERLVRERTAELEQSQAALRLSERMAALGTFAAGLGHDITNTLLPLRVRVEEVLAEPTLDERTKTEILGIVGFLKYLQSLARGLRLFAQDPDHPTGPEERTDLAAWCVDTLPFFRASVPAHIELVCDIPPGLPNVAVAPHRLSQAVLNLVHNARDAVATPCPGPEAGAPRARITIVAHAEDEGRAVSIAVTDNGAGMTDEVRRRCLEPFFSTKTRGMGGTGLGLSMVHGIAARAGGEDALRIDSAPGRGTTVTLRLPTVPEPGDPNTPQHRTAFITVADKRIEAFTAAIAGALGRRTVTAPPPHDGECPGDCWITDAASTPTDRALAFIQRTGPNRLIFLGNANGSVPPGAVVIPDTTSLGRLREALAAAAREETTRAS